MTMQGVPTLYPNGVSNAATDSFGARVPMPWPAQYYTWFDDFDRFNAAASGTADWLATLTNTLITGAQVNDAQGGILTITNTAADDDAFFAQWMGQNASATGGVAETFTFQAGKELWFAARFNLAEVIQSDFIIGLAIADTTPLDATDGVFFLKTDGAATLALTSKIVTPVTASVTVATLVNNTFVEVAYHYNGIDTIQAYVNNAPAGRLGVTALPTTELALTLGLQNGEAVAKTANIDWMFCARER